MELKSRFPGRMHTTMRRIRETPDQTPDRKRQNSRTGFPVRFLVVLFLIAFSPEFLSAITPEYLTNENEVILSAEDPDSPLDGLPIQDEDPVEPGVFGETTGSYLPVFEELFSEAVFSFAPRSYYLRRVDGSAIREEAAFGGTATLTTGWWRDLIRFRVSGSTSGALHTPGGRNGTGLLKPDGSSYWTRGEAHLEARWRDLLTVKGPWQEMDLPFFNANDSRMTPNIHEAWLAGFPADPRFTVGGGHVTRIKTRTDTSFRALSDVAGAPGTNRGATLAGFRYRWREENSSLGVLNGYGWDTFNSFYAETGHDFEFSSGLDWNTTAQLMTQDSVGDAFLGAIDTHAVGIQTALSYAGVVGTVGVTRTDSGGTIRNPWGGSPLMNSSMISDFDRAGEISRRVALSTSLESLGLPWVRFQASYVQGDTPDAGLAASADQEEVNLTLDLKPEEGKMEGLWLRFRQAWNEGLRGRDHEDFRVVLNYSKPF